LIAGDLRFDEGFLGEAFIEGFDAQVAVAKGVDQTGRMRFCLEAGGIGVNFFASNLAAMKWSSEEVDVEYWE